MDLLLLRDRYSPVDTTGELIDRTGGKRDLICYVLEDQVREGPKVYGRTAIPAGSYRIQITRSPRFARDLPLLLDVPGFSGIRIHTGNSHEDTEGCLLPGLDRVWMPNGSQRVTRSRDAFGRLQLRIQGALARGETVTIQIVNGTGTGGA